MKRGRGSMTTDEYKKIVSASVSEEAEQIHLMQCAHGRKVSTLSWKRFITYPMRASVQLSQEASSGRWGFALVFPIYAFPFPKESI